MPSASRVVVLTGSELRHRFVRKALALSPGLHVVRSICEDLTGSLVDRVRAKADAPLQAAHLEARARSEEDFFGKFDELAPDKSNPLPIERGSINDSVLVEVVAAPTPDLIISYGCSILREVWLSKFPRRIVNVHLGLSPYYRGGGTNFWPLVNQTPEYVGATFMHIAPGVDTGPIIHQIRARVFPGDSPHQIGNRLIVDMIDPLASIAAKFDSLPSMPQPDMSIGREYKMRDLTEESVSDLCAAFSGGLVDRYLSEQQQRCAAVPIIENPGVA